MKLLFITNNLYCQDGWSRHSKDLIDQLKNNGNDVLVAVNRSKDGYEVRQSQVLEDPIKYLGNLFRIWITSRKIQILVDSYKPDVIHFLVEPYVLCLPFIRTGGAKTVLTVYGTYSYIPNVINGRISRKLFTWFYHKTLLKVSAITSDSHYTAKYLMRNVDKKYSNNISAKLKVINNGVDLSIFKPEDSRSKNNSDPKQILFVGLIKPRKGILEALKAIDCYKQKYNANFIYNIVGAYEGNDGYYSELVKYIKDHNLGDKVKFWGRVEQNVLAELYKKADLFMMLSINSGHNFEGYGLVYLEANASGVPAIGPINCGAEDAIVDQKTGYLVDPIASNMVADKIHDIIDLQKISRYDCLNWAENNSVKRQAARFANLYTEIKND